MRPPDAFEDAVGSVAAAAGGFLIAGCLYAGGAFNESVLVVCTIEAAFFGSLTLWLAYYHGRWTLETFTAAFVVLLPYVVNLLWARFSSTSLMYPVAALVFISGVTLGTAHHKIAGPQPDDDAEEQIIRTFMAEVDAHVTWKDGVTWLCIIASVVILLVLRLGRQPAFFE